MHTGYLIAAIVAILGFPTGYYIAKLCKEEIKPGRKYFSIMQYVMLALILLVLALFGADKMDNITAFSLLATLIYIGGLSAGSVFYDHKHIRRHEHKKKRKTGKKQKKKKSRK